VRVLASLFGKPAPVAASVAPPPVRLPVIEPVYPTLGGPPPIQDLDEIRAELRRHHKGRKHGR